MEAFAKFLHTLMWASHPVSQSPKNFAIVVSFGCMASLPKSSNIALKGKLDWIAMAISRIKEGIR